MIYPHTRDIGRNVVRLTSWVDDDGEMRAFSEKGVITSFNDSYVFVRYGSDTESKATRRVELDWIY